MLADKIIEIKGYLENITVRIDFSSQINNENYYLKALNLLNPPLKTYATDDQEGEFM